jgi:cbb3-type cytochrome oxidase subunit 3
MEVVALTLVIFFIVFVLGLYADYNPSDRSSEPQKKNETSINYFMGPK